MIEKDPVTYGIIGCAMKVHNTLGNGFQEVIYQRSMEIEMKQLADQGLGAIEVYNSCQKPNENAFYQKMAKRFNLVATGGSDFHGANKPGVDLGFLGENVTLGYEMVEALRQVLREEGSVRRAEELAREYKAKADIAPRHVEERIHSEELVNMEKSLTSNLGGKIKVTQSMREARMVIVLKGNIEKTGGVLRKIKQALLQKHEPS